MRQTGSDLLFGLRQWRTNPGFMVVARLADGVTVERQSAAMAAIPTGHAPVDREASAPKAFRLRPLEEFLVPVGMRVMTAGLLGAVAVVLLVACLNLASISAARTAARRQELAIRAAVNGLGIDEILTAPRSPWQNPFVERLVGSIHRECLDHVIVCNESSLRRHLRQYVAHYHRWRTHLSLDKDAPDRRVTRPDTSGRIVEVVHVGGLHHRRERRAA